MDFRLKVVVAVADAGSFTAAARELYISQPAVSKHISELESYYETQIFSRGGGRVRPTLEGEIIISHAKEILARYNALKMEVNLLSNHFSGELRIGASTTIASYLMPEYLSEFIKRMPDVKLTVFSGNSNDVTENILAGKSDLGLIEGPGRVTGLRYNPYERDELVLVTSTKNRERDEVSLEELKRLPLVLRENGSGTLDVIDRKLKEYNTKLSDLNVLFQIGSTEAIKRFIDNYPSAYTIVSIAAVSREIGEGRYRIVDTDDIEWCRNFTAVTLPGDRNEIAERFLQLISYNKKL